MKKEIRSDNTYMISTDSTDNPKLGAKILSDGRESLFLDYYLGYYVDDNGNTKKQRKRESLKLYLHPNPRTPFDKNLNRETLSLARGIRYEREQELKQGKLGYRLKAKETNFLDFCDTYAETYAKADNRVIKQAVKRFKQFLSERHPIYATNLPPNKVDKLLMEEFLDYVLAHGVGDGPSTVWSRFKKVCKNAVVHEVLESSPCAGMICPNNDGCLTKDVLSIDEMALLITNPPPTLNEDVRRGFIFTLYTGTRFCDVKVLTYRVVDYANKIIRFQQSKTKNHSKSSWVHIPLTDELMELIGTPKESEDELIFKLPSHTGCLKALRSWTKHCNISKHITWHCGRHSFATNVLANGANTKTVASLLGHSSLKYTEIYVHAIDKLKADAVASLPKLKLVKNNESEEN